MHDSDGVSSTLVGRFNTKLFLEKAGAGYHGEIGTFWLYSTHLLFIGTSLQQHTSLMFLFWSLKRRVFAIIFDNSYIQLKFILFYWYCLCCASSDMFFTRVKTQFHPKSSIMPNIFCYTVNISNIVIWLKIVSDLTIGLLSLENPLSNRSQILKELSYEIQLNRIFILFFSFRPLWWPWPWCEGPSQAAGTI